MYNVNIHNSYEKYENMKITHKPSTILSVCFLASYFKCRNVSLVRSSQSKGQGNVQDNVMQRAGS